jgi:hypothetical protein
MGRSEEGEVGLLGRVWVAEVGRERARARAMGGESWCKCWRERDRLGGEVEGGRSSPGCLLIRRFDWWLGFFHTITSLF